MMSSPPRDRLHFKFAYMVEIYWGLVATSVEAGCGNVTRNPTLRGIASSAARRQIPQFFLVFVVNNA